MKKAFTRYMFAGLAGWHLASSFPCEAQTSTDPVIYFLCARRPLAEWTPEYGQTFVIPIQKPEHLAQARALVKSPDFFNGWPRGWVAPSGDRINRDLLAPGRPEHCWHMAEFALFTGALTPEDGTSPESLTRNGFCDLPAEFRWPYGFYDYCPVLELGPTPCLVNANEEGDRLRLTWPDFGPAYHYTLEASASLVSPNWQPVAGHAWPSTDTEFTVPLVEGTGRFFRVTITPAP